MEQGAGGGAWLEHCSKSHPSSSSIGIAPKGLPLALPFVAALSHRRRLLCTPGHSAHLTLAPSSSAPPSVRPAASPATAAATALRRRLSITHQTLGYNNHVYCSDGGGAAARRRRGPRSRGRQWFHVELTIGGRIANFPGTSKTDEEEEEEGRATCISPETSVQCLIPDSTVRKVNSCGTSFLA